MAEFTLTLTPEPGGWKYEVALPGAKPSFVGLAQTKEIARLSALEVIRGSAEAAGSGKPESFTVTADGPTITACVPVTTSPVKPSGS